MIEINDMKGSGVLHLLVVMLTIYHTLKADRCSSSKVLSVRCGDECSWGGNCIYGEGSEKLTTQPGAGMVATVRRLVMTLCDTMYVRLEPPSP